MNTARLKSPMDLVSTALVIALCSVLLWKVLATDRPVLKANAAARPGRPEPPLPAEPVPVDGAYMLGSIAAPVVLIEYSDFQCPFCAKFVHETLPQLKSNYIDGGRLSLAFVSTPLEEIHPQALGAAKSAQCAAEQGRFWNIHDQLFANPKALDTERLRAYAVAAGVDARAFDRCLSNQGTEDHVRATIALGKAASVQGTPTFLLGTRRPDGRVLVTKRLVGALPYQAFSTEIDPLINSSAKR